MNKDVLMRSRSRRVISKDTQQTMLFMVLTAVVVAVCGVLGANFIEDIGYNSQVLSALHETNDTLKHNLTVADKLDNNVKNLENDKNLQKLRINSSDSSLQVILDSMPTIDNRAALAASLQASILNRSGVVIQQINVNNSASAQNTTGKTAKTGAQPAEFNVIILGEYDAIQRAIQDIERSIRPITINNVTINGGTELRASISATTYFAPLIDYKLGSKEIERK